MRNLVFGVLAFMAPVTARAQTVSYTVSVPKPTSSLLHVVMEIRGAPGRERRHRDAGLVARLLRPALGREERAGVSRRSDGIRPRARCGDGRTRRVWRIKPVAPAMRVAYDVYMGDLVGQRHARDDHRHARADVLDRPRAVSGAGRADGRRSTRRRTGSSATGLDAVRPGVFTAPDYDTLVDAPIEASPELEIITFEHDKVPYEIVIHARHNYDTARLRDDVRKIVAEEARLMGGAPSKRYVFFFHGTNGGSGGLEHLNSTSITFGRYAQDNKSAYQRFQFVIAHEFFHLWNVKRIRPEILGPFDYSRPQHTRNLYVSEGMTSYFAALALVRSGVWDRQTFYDDLATNIQELQTQPGHLVTSAEMSSWLTWNRQDNAANVTISYYTKGQILGTLLDLDMRARTGNKKSLGRCVPAVAGGAWAAQAGVRGGRRISRRGGEDGGERCGQGRLRRVLSALRVGPRRTAVRLDADRSRFEARRSRARRRLDRSACRPAPTPIASSSTACRRPEPPTMRG